MNLNPKPRPWRTEFLRAIARTGNGRIAAREAGVNPSTPHEYRKRNPVFASDWARALAAAQTALAEGRMPPRRRPAHGKARPRVLSRCADGQLKLIEPAWDRWDEDKEAAFLDAYMETANITAAAAAVNISTQTIHRRCRDWPAFDRAMEDTRMIAAKNLNMQLIKAGSDTMSPPKVAYDIPTPLVSVSDAIRIVQMNLPELRDRTSARTLAVPVKPMLSSEELVARIEATLAQLPPEDGDPDVSNGPA